MRQLPHFIGDFKSEIYLQAWWTEIAAREAFKRWPPSEITCLKGLWYKTLFLKVKALHVSIPL